MAADLAVRERIPAIIGPVGSDMVLTENGEATVSICDLADVTVQDVEVEYSKKIHIVMFL